MSMKERKPKITRAPAPRRSPSGPRPAPETRMADVGAKPPTARRAVAEGHLRLDAAARRALRAAMAGDAGFLEGARLAGIMAAKRAAEILPLCHPIPLDHLAVQIRLGPRGLAVRATAATRASTGVEMEALAAVTVAALAVASRLDPAAAGACLEGLRLLEKSGGRSGDFRRR